MCCPRQAHSMGWGSVSVCCVSALLRHLSVAGGTQGGGRRGRSCNHQWLKEHLNSVVSLRLRCNEMCYQSSLSVLTVTKDGFAQNLLLDFPKGFLCSLVISIFRYLTELTMQ